MERQKILPKQRRVGADWDRVSRHEIVFGLALELYLIDRMPESFLSYPVRQSAWKNGLDPIPRSDCSPFFPSSDRHAIDDQMVILINGAKLGHLSCPYFLVNMG